jgi:hypothetical protein
MGALTTAADRSVAKLTEEELIVAWSNPWRKLPPLSLKDREATAPICRTPAAARFA